jgi:hypothetical protein
MTLEFRSIPHDLVIGASLIEILKSFFEEITFHCFLIGFWVEVDLELQCTKPF